MGVEGVRWVMHLIPMERPTISMTANGPAVAHSSDFTLVKRVQTSGCWRNLICLHDRTRARLPPFLVRISQRLAVLRSPKPIRCRRAWPASKCS